MSDSHATPEYCCHLQGTYDKKKKDQILIRKEMENKSEIYDATWLYGISVTLIFIMVCKDNFIILNFQ